MQVTKGSRTGWKVKATKTDIKKLEAAIECIAPLVEVPVDCQQTARDADLALCTLRDFLVGKVGPETRPLPGME